MAIPRRKSGQLSKSGQSVRVGKVFVAGGLPTVTYVPREALNLEQNFEDYLDEGHRVLSVSGPTKTGKTVLIRSVLRDDSAIWLSGGAISSAEEFWATLADHLGVHTTIETSSTSSERATSSSKGQINILAVQGGVDSGSDSSNSISDKFTRNRPVAMAVRSELLREQYPIVVDDFHYIPAEAQLEIVRGLKDLIFEGLPVIVIAVPHRAYDVVRVEREMTGRVQQLKVSFWSDDDLKGIATAGFAALNVVDDGGDLAARLVKESFGSPHLMRDFCLNLCKANNIREAVAKPVKLKAPNWDNFFAERSSLASKTAFELLARGPRQRTDRKPRVLKNGSTTDIYGATLEAIAWTGPLTEVTYEQVRGGLREVMADEIPQRHEVTRVLEEMARIAREQTQGEPVVDYDVPLATLYIADPYFAFFLRWGQRTTT
ncbi:hypothetical protein ABH920_005980 [Catenulispora sp. EB89]|uniref:hypothetical protein n=1 Tax=Catenulispora sp. EB89 TaxID=3156257 RepID=UPI003510E987